MSSAVENLSAVTNRSMSRNRI